MLLTRSDNVILAASVVTFVLAIGAWSFPESVSLGLFGASLVLATIAASIRAVRGATLRQNVLTSGVVGVLTSLLAICVIISALYLAADYGYVEVHAFGRYWPWWTGGLATLAWVALLYIITAFVGHFIATKRPKART